jgi:hypothetical protein
MAFHTAATPTPASFADAMKEVSLFPEIFSRVMGAKKPLLMEKGNVPGKYC